MAEIKKKGTRLVSFDETNSLVVHSVDKVFIFSEEVFTDIQPPDRLRSEDVGPEIRSVAYPLDLAGELFIEAMVGGTKLSLRSMIAIAAQMPLADHSGRVAIFSEHLSQGYMFCRERIRCIGPQVIEDSVTRGELACEETCAVGRTDWGGGIGLGKADSLKSHAVKVGGLVEPVSVASELRPAEIVGEDEDDVRRLPGGGPGCRKQGTGEDEDSNQPGPAFSDFHRRLFHSWRLTGSAEPVLSLLQLVPAIF